MTIQDNKTLLQKADIAVADFASGGALNAAQADQFIRLAIRQSVFLGDVSVSPMANPQEDRDKLRFASRVLKPGTEAVALSLGDRSTPNLSTVQLDAKLFRAEVRMSEEVLEDQIERGAFQNTIMQSLSAAIARDIETVVINGDTASGNALLAVLDGVLKQATANLVAAGSATLDKGILRDVHKALDDEFSNIPDLKFWTNRQAKIDYRDSLSDRATNLGDAQLLQRDGSVWNDMPVVAVPEFPPTAEVGGTDTQVLHSSGDNLLVGFLRRVRMATQMDAPAGVVIIVASVRFDTKIVEVNAAAKATAVSGT